MFSAVSMLCAIIILAKSERVFLRRTAYFELARGELSIAIRVAILISCLEVR